MPVPQHFNLFLKEWPVEGVGMVEIRQFSEFLGHIPLVVVVRILRDDRYAFGRQRVDDVLYDGGLSGPRSSGYSDDDHMLIW